jgi:single-strand DNA-binding protein
MLPIITGEFGVVGDPEIRFSEKGSAWLKVRGVAKDRVRDANGTWGDGDPLFIDILVNNGAENLYDSIVKGDSIIVTGKLKQREYEHNGEKRVDIQIRAESVGVSTRWNSAKTPKSLESNSSIETAKESLGAVEIEPTEAPF